MGRRCNLSLLPQDVLNILGLLPIVSAARTAVLSRAWRDAWLSLTHLNFDVQFISQIQKKHHECYRYRDTLTLNEIQTYMTLHVVNKVLKQHNGPICKFVCDFRHPQMNFPTSWSSLIDQWLIFIAWSGVQELHLSFCREDGFRVPHCLFSCSTLRKLHLCGVPPVNGPWKLGNATSLCFENVSLDPIDISVDVPMLENLPFVNCYNIVYLNITSPKIGALTVEDCYSDLPFHFLPINLDLRSVHTPRLDSSSIEAFVTDYMRRGLQPPTLNVECLSFSEETAGNDYDMSPAFIQLLQLCPKLFKLGINLELAQITRFWLNGESKLWVEFYSVAQALERLTTLEVYSFDGCDEHCMPFIKRLLSCFPKLEKVVIVPDETYINSDKRKSRFLLDLLGHHNASTKNVEISFKW